MYYIKPLMIPSLLCLAILVHAQVRYTLSFTDSVAGRLRISIEPATPLATPISFVMPRSAPGDYSIVKYDLLVENLQATAEDGSQHPCGIG
jgi:hypothetical protein